MSEAGIFYLVAISYNDIDDIMKQMHIFGFDGSIVKKRQLRGELLFVLKFVKRFFRSDGT